MRENNVAAVAVRPEPFQKFIDKVDQEHEQLIWTHPNVSSYYRNSTAGGIGHALPPGRLLEHDREPSCPTTLWTNDFHNRA